MTAGGLRCIPAQGLRHPPHHRRHQGQSVSQSGRLSRLDSYGMCLCFGMGEMGNGWMGWITLPLIPCFVPVIDVPHTSTTPSPSHQPTNQPTKLNPRPYPPLHPPSIIIPLFLPSQAHIELPEVHAAMRAGRLVPDGKILTAEGQVFVTKARMYICIIYYDILYIMGWGLCECVGAMHPPSHRTNSYPYHNLTMPPPPPNSTPQQAAIEPVWYLPAVAERFGV